MIKVSSYYQARGTFPLARNDRKLIHMRRREDDETYSFPTWRSAMAYIEELLEKGRCVISAVQVEEVG